MTKNENKNEVIESTLVEETTNSEVAVKEEGKCKQFIRKHGKKFAVGVGLFLLGVLTERFAGERKGDSATLQLAGGSDDEDEEVEE